MLNDCSDARPGSLEKFEVEKDDSGDNEDVAYICFPGYPRGEWKREDRFRIWAQRKRVIDHDHIEDNEDDTEERDLKQEFHDGGTLVKGGAKVIARTRQ